MIYPTNIRISSAVDNAGTLAAAKAHSRKGQAPHVRSPGSPQPAPEATSLISRMTAANAVQNLGEIRTLEDAGQAAAATQQASLLIQTKPQLALDAQANTSSQSVARLLQ